MAPLHPPSSDIILNRHNVALAQSQRLIASWLPPRAAANSSATSPKQEEETKTEEEKEELEDAIFTPAPELLGFGATVPKDEEGAGNEKLGKRLLGRDFLKILERGKREGGRGGAGAGVRGRGSKLRPADARREVHGDGEGEDEEGGRSSLGKAKLAARKRVRELEHDGIEDDVDLEAEKSAVYGSRARSEAPKRASNYLDEVLADRSQKRRKKSKRKGGDVGS